MAEQSPNKSQRGFMRRALGLARKGLGRTSPNPAVGAVVVAGGKVVGRGFHAKAGEPHAEVHALAMAGPAAKGADIYVTLEPCNHTGRTPPCTRAILEAGITRVFYGASDPNPKAFGGGDFLRAKGLQVTGGVLRDACEHEHRFFLKHLIGKRPYVLLKTAATMDGKTAAGQEPGGAITGRQSLRQVHRLRNWLDAICVGSGTALADDPSLTCRLRGGRNPLRVIVDTNLKLPPNAKVLDPAAPGGCLVACGPRPPARKRRALEKAGAQVLPLPKHQGRVDLAALLDELGRRGLLSLLLEGGASLAWGFLSQGLVDEIAYFYAPKIIGGLNAPPMVAGPGLPAMDQAIHITNTKIRRFGDDVMVGGRWRRG